MKASQLTSKRLDSSEWIEEAKIAKPKCVHEFCESNHGTTHWKDLGRSWQKKKKKNSSSVSYLNHDLMHVNGCKYSTKSTDYEHYPPSHFYKLLKLLFVKYTKSYMDVFKDVNCKVSLCLEQII